MLVKYTLKKSSLQRPTLESVKRRLFHDDDTSEPSAKRVRFGDIGTFVNQPNLQTSNAALNSVNVQMANCTLIANQSMNLSNFGAESGTVLSYPCTINQPMFVNYCPGAIIQAQSPAVYYYLSPEANVYRNQFVYFNPAPTNQQISIGNVQIPIQHSVLQNEFIPMNRALFEKYNISFNDAL